MRNAMNAALDVAAFASELRAAGFEGDVEHDAGTGVVYGTDNSIYQLRPAGAVVPAGTDDLAVLASVNDRLGRPFSFGARGGGTGTNGQSLTDSLVVDTRRRMNRIVSIDPDARTAVVQPGVVLGQLNAALRPHGLFFAPHVSTATRATIGGMVATDAAGKGSLVYGRTNRHVLGVDAVLADGTRLDARRLDAHGVEAAITSGGRLGELHRCLADATAGIDADAFPDVPRGFTGYNLADAAEGTGGLAVTKLLAGSEGTLALFGELTIRLEPIIASTTLAVIAYDTFDAAVRDSNRLKAASPIAIECLDERTLSRAVAAPVFGRLAALLGDGVDPTERPTSLLLMEFADHDSVDAMRELLDESDAVRSFAITAEPDDIAAVWKVRADAVGLLGRSVGGRRSVPFVEDCAVPPDRLEKFVSEFRALLARHGLAAGMFGHADVGCVHVRPALDLLDTDHEALVRTVSNEVHELVSSFGGVLWGEHGRGFRGEFLDVSDDVLHRMRLVKTAFDPHNVMNPGKLYAPLDVDTAIARIDEVPLRVHTDRTVDPARRSEFDSAFGCNGNGICHHWGDAEVMCPSYKVTSDPRQSPKGRADLLRAWAATPADAELADAVADSLHTCLSCAACTGRCPVQVDIPELKSRFLAQRSPTPWRERARHAVLSRFESMLPAAQRVAPVTRVAQRAGAPLLHSLLGVVDLPTVPSSTLASRLDALGMPLLTDADLDAGVGDATVIVVPDAFTAMLEPSVLDATLRVLRHLGETPAVAPLVASGKYDHVHGRRARFARAVAKRRRLLERLARCDGPLVGVEPAVSLLGPYEDRAIDPDFPSDALVSLADFLEPRIAELPIGDATPRPTAQLFGHCSEVSLAPERTEAYRSMLEAAGYDVTVEATTCCGMAGVFGHEAEHQEMSRALFDNGWRARLDGGGHAVRCAPGFSCRSQAHRFGHRLTHPIEVLADQLDA